MCTNPRKIYNPTRLYYRNLTPYKLEVPCLECDDCRNQHSDEWLVRLTYELRSYLKSGGKCIFPTLTYNNAHVPHFHFINPLDDKDVDFLCFRPKDIKIFIKRLRNFFKSEGLKPKRVVNGVVNDYNSELGIKYLVASEFGSDNVYLGSDGRLHRGTFRPHFHVLLFLPAWIMERYSLEDIANIIQCCWSDSSVKDLSIKRYRVKCRGVKFNFPSDLINGEVRYSEGEGKLKMTVSEDFALRYVCKYMNKDKDFSCYYKVVALKKLVENKQLDSCVLREITPKHYQSTMIGHDILSDLSYNNDFLKDGIDLTHSKFFDNQFVIDEFGKNYRYPVPRIYRDKFLYDKKYVCFDYANKPVFKKVLKPEHVKLVRNCFRDSIIDGIERTRQFLKNLNVTLPADMEKLDYPGASRDDVREYLQSGSDYVTLKNFYLYAKFYHGRLLSPDVYYELFCGNYDLGQFAEDSYIAYQLAKVPDLHYCLEKGVGFFRHFMTTKITEIGDELHNLIPACNLPQFRDFQHFSSLVNKLKNYLKHERIQKYLADSDREKAINRYKATSDKRYSKQQYRKLAYI